MFTFYLQLPCCRVVTNIDIYIPVVFICKGVEVFLLLVYDVLQAFIDWRTAVPDLLQHSLKDNDITNHRVFQNVNLQNKGKWVKICYL